MHASGVPQCWQINRIKWHGFCQKFHFIDAPLPLQIKSLYNSNNKTLTWSYQTLQVYLHKQKTHVMSFCSVFSSLDGVPTKKWREEKNQKDDGKRFQINWLGWTMSILLTYDFNRKAQFTPQSFFCFSRKRHGCFLMQKNSIWYWIKIDILTQTLKRFEPMAMIDLVRYE